MERSSCDLRRAAAPAARGVLSLRHSSLAAQSTSEISSGFPSRPPPQTETTGVQDEGQSEHPIPKPRVTQERGTAPPQAWQPRLKLSYTRCSYRAQQELCSRAAKAPMPGLLPHLTLQITGDKRAECSTALVTDLPTLPTRSRHYQHLTGLIAAHTSNAKLHLPVCSP